MIKRRLELFQTNDYEAIEKHLAKMAKKGWFLESIGTFLWTYRKGEPQDLTYEVTYFSEASDFNPYPTDNQETYYEYCKAAGWNLVASKDKLQIFSNAQDNPTPIDNDKELKLQSIHKSMKKSLLVIYGLLLFLSLFQIIMIFRSIISDPIIFFTTGTSIYNSFLWGITVLYIIYLFLDYFLWYHGSKKALALGINYERDHYKTRKIITMVFMAILIILLLSYTIVILSQNYWWAGVIGIAFMAAIIFVFSGATKLMKKAKASGRVNLSVTLGALMVAVIALSSIIFRGIIFMADRGILHKEPHSSYTLTDNHGNTSTHSIYKDSLPLTLEDMYVVIDNRDYSYELEHKDSFAVNYIRASQEAPVYSESAPHLYYELAEVKVPRLYDSFKNSFMERYYRTQDNDEVTFVLISNTDWGADEVYQLKIEGELVHIYLICYEDKILNIVLGFPPLKEQIEIIREKLIGDQFVMKYTINDGLSVDNISFGEVGP